MSNTNDNFNLNRRQFLRLAGATAAAFSLPLPACENAVHEITIGETSVIWLEGATCTGCGVSLLNSSNPTIASLLTDFIALRFHETLMAQAGEPAMQVLENAVAGAYGDYFLVLDGALTVGEHEVFTSIGTVGNREIFAMETAKNLADRAVGVVALGTCASFGGIPAAAAGVVNALPVSQALQRDDIINVPGCPPHPSWTIATLVAAVTRQPIALDSLNRPLALYSKTVHDLCPRREYYEQNDFAPVPGDPKRCFYEIGCKGPFTHANCPTTLWHDERTFCINTNHPCIGCSAPGFIDRAPNTSHYPMSPFYDQSYDQQKDQDQ